MARRLGKIKSCKNLAKFHPRFWQDNVRQEIAKTSYINFAKFLARFWQDHARLPRCVTRFLPSFLQDFGKIMQGSPDKKLPRCVTSSCQVSCKILARSCKAVQTRSYKILAKFLARFWHDHARQSRQEIAKMCYKILAKFLARFWQDHARQSRQEIAKMCYKILAKFLARLRQESCMILERFGTCNDIHNSRIHSTFLSYSLVRPLFLKL